MNIFRLLTVTLTVVCSILNIALCFQLDIKHYKAQNKANYLSRRNNKNAANLNVIEVVPNIWATRRKLVRLFLKGEAKKRFLNNNQTTQIDPNLATKATIGISAFFIAIGATVFRFGGRAAFVQFLGLDFITNTDLKTQIDSFIASFESLGDLRFVGFFAAWLIAKFICIDFFVLILALSSGVLFGGVVQGTVVSIVCSTLSSLPPFFVSRYCSVFAAIIKCRYSAQLFLH